MFNGFSIEARISAKIASRVLADSFGHDWKISDSSGFLATAFCEAVSEATAWPCGKSLGKSACFEGGCAGSNPTPSAIFIKPNRINGSVGFCVLHPGKVITPSHNVLKKSSLPFLGV